MGAWLSGCGCVEKKTPVAASELSEALTHSSAGRKSRQCSRVRVCCLFSFPLTLFVLSACVLRLSLCDANTAVCVYALLRVSFLICFALPQPTATLHDAARIGNAEVVTYLLGSGHDVNSRTKVRAATSTLHKRVQKEQSFALLTWL